MKKKFCRKKGGGYGGTLVHSRKRNLVLRYMSRKVVGTKDEVWAGLASRTPGKLTKSDLMVNKNGKVVSKKQHQHGLNMLEHIAPFQGSKTRVPTAVLKSLLRSSSSRAGKKIKPNIRPRAGKTKPKLVLVPKQGGKGVYVSQGGNLFGDIMDGIGKVVDVGAKVVPHFL